MSDGTEAGWVFNLFIYYAFVIDGIQKCPNGNFGKKYGKCLEYVTKKKCIKFDWKWSWDFWKSVKEWSCFRWVNEIIRCDRHLIVDDFDNCLEDLVTVGVKCIGRVVPKCTVWAKNCGTPEDISNVGRDCGIAMIPFVPVF